MDLSRVPQRIQRQRTRGWRKPAGAVDVTRSGRWSNKHYKVGIHGTAEECMRLFESRYEHDTAYQAAVRATLHGKILMCWCPLDAPCHADVLLRWANAPAATSEAGRSQAPRATHLDAFLADGYCDRARVTISYWFDSPEERSPIWGADGSIRETRARARPMPLGKRPVGSGNGRRRGERSATALGLDHPAGALSQARPGVSPSRSMWPPSQTMPSAHASIRPSRTAWRSPGRETCAGAILPIGRWDAGSAKPRRQPRRGRGGLPGASEHRYAVVAHMGHPVCRDPVAARAPQVQWEQDQCAVPVRGRDFSACGRDTRRGRCAGGPRLSLTTSPQHRESRCRARAKGRGLVPPAERDTPGSLGASMRSSTSDILAGTADLLAMAQADFRWQAGVRPVAGVGGGRAALAVGLQRGGLCAVSPAR